MISQQIDIASFFRDARSKIGSAARFTRAFLDLMIVTSCTDIVPGCWGAKPTHEGTMKTETRGCAIALAVLVGSAVAVMPALADGGRTPSRSDQSSYPPIWQGAYVGLHLGHGEAGPADGLVGGGQIGYNWQSGSIVYGLEADVSYADISFGNASIDWMATARGRLGYLLLPNLLAYGTVGFGLASGSASFGGFSLNDTESDIVYGLGLEGKFSDKLSARIEYLAFGDLNIDVVRVGLNYRLGN